MAEWAAAVLKKRMKVAVAGVLGQMETKVEKMPV